MGNLPVSMSNVISFENNNWFLDYRYSILSTIDYDKCEIIHKVYLSKGDYSDYPKVYGIIVCVGNKIVAVPEAPVPIPVYNSKTEELHYIDYKMNFAGFPGKIFSTAIVSGVYVYFIPCCYDSIVRLNTENYELKYYSLDRYVDDKGPGFLWDGFIENDKGFIISTMYSNVILSFSFETGIVGELVRVPDVDGIAGVFHYSNNSMLIIPIKADKVFKYSFSTSSLEKVSLFSDKYDAGKFSFSRILDRSGTVFLLPREANMIVVLGADRIVKEINVDRCDDSYFSRYYLCSNVEFYNDEWWFFNADGTVKCYNKSFDKWREVTLSIKSDKIHRDLKGIISEDSIWNLKRFINNL